MHSLLLSFANNESERLNTLRKECREVGDALRDRQSRKDFIVISESMATREFIIDNIRSQEADLCLFLFSGHAGRDSLFFEDGNANVEGISKMLGRCKNLKLVILNGCSTAGQVQALLSSGVPVVVATSSPVGDEKATHFSISFFKELSQKELPVKEAFERAIESTKVIGQINHVEVTRGLVTQSEIDDALWGLYYKEESALLWTLPIGELNENDQKVKPLSWSIISVIVTIGFLATTFLFVKYYKELNQINSSNYYFLLLIAAIIPTGFLFGSFKTAAKYTGNVIGGKVELGGAAALYFCLVGIGMANKPKEKPFSFTVNVFSETDSTETINNGVVKLIYGQAAIPKQISEGQSTFKEIPVEFENENLILVAEANGYFSRRQKIIIDRNNAVVNLYLKKIADEVHVSGLVLDKKKRPVRNAELFFGSQQDGIKTDSLGMYSASLPYKDGTETTVSIFKDGTLRFKGLMTLSGINSKDFQLGSL